MRLQCYEGLTASEALYDWNYQRQLLSIRLAEAAAAPSIAEADLYTEAYLVDRPILQCVRHRGPAPPVLLIDEIDRADDEFEALLLEFLGEAAVTVPELGTFVAERPPIAVLTSNRSRDLHDALRRRCLYHWIDYPEPVAGRRDRASHRARCHRAADRTCHPIRRHRKRSRPGQAARAWPRPSTGSPPWWRSGSPISSTTVGGMVSLGALAKTPDDRTLIRDALVEYSRT